jgi:ubiquinone/menaquinone biosynthesis C-methylase UbiE
MKKALKQHPRFAKFYINLSKLMEKSGVGTLREQVLEHARGNVLEVGCGNGMNFNHYDPAKVNTVTAIEPEQILLKQAIKNANLLTPSITVFQGQSEKLPFRNSCFDSVVFTLVLCSVLDPIKSLQEAKRVLKPGGKIVLLEHIKADSSLLLSAQKLANLVWPYFAGGCRLTRNTPSLVETSGFVNINKKLFSFLPTPLAVLTSPMVILTAQKP